MSKEAMLAIKQAEEQAEVLLRVAEEKAAEMRAEVEKEGLAHCNEVKRAADAEYAKTIADIKERTERLTEKKQGEAMAEAEAVKQAAEEKMDAAVDLIVWGIIESCQ